MSPKAQDAEKDTELRAGSHADRASTDLGQQDRLLQDALEPILQSSIKDAFKNHSPMMVDSIYPVVGRAVRRSVRESLKGLAESIDLKMRNALTFKRLRWRWEARRQGVSVAELVLRESLLYRVEEVFCIHPDTGLMIRHIGTRAEEDRDLVSGMFTAIQSFVSSSFNRDDDASPDSLDRCQVGENDVWLIHGPVAYLAVVIVGEAPAELRNDFHTVLESIHTQFAPQLKSFDGDSSKYDELSLLLEDCMVEQKREVERGRKPVLFRLLAVALCGALLWVGWGWFRQNQAHKEATKQLGEVPGVAIIESDRGWRHSTFDLMVDPGAQLQVDAIAAEHKARATFKSQPFLSAEPEAVRQRFRQDWQTFAGEGDRFELVPTKGSFKIRGEVSHRWLGRARAAAGSAGLPLPVDFSEVRNRDREKFDSMAQTLSGLSVAFLPGQYKVSPGESPKWLQLANQMKAMKKFADTGGFGISFNLYAEAANEVQDESTTALAEARTLHAYQQLRAQGLAPAALVSQGLMPSTVQETLGRDPTPSSLTVVPLFH